MVENAVADSITEQSLGRTLFFLQISEDDRHWFQILGAETAVALERLDVSNVPLEKTVDTKACRRGIEGGSSLSRGTTDGVLPIAAVTSETRLQRYRVSGAESCCCTNDSDSLQRV